MAEVLSQSQIDALLNAARNGEMDLASTAENKNEKKYRKYDFYSPRKFTKDRLKMISGIFESYCRIINSWLNGFLHTNCEIEVDSVEEQRYYEFSNALSEGDVLTLADVVGENLSSIDDSPVLFHFTTPLMLSMMDRLMGGSGASNPNLPAGYKFTEVELRLYESIVKELVAMMGGSWVDYIDIDFKIRRIESNPTLVQVIGLDETVVIIGASVRFSNSSGRISICFPGMKLINIFAQMAIANQNLHKKSEDNSEEIMGVLKESTLEITAELGRTQLRLQDVYSLKPGDVIDLGHPVSEPIYLNIGGKEWFSGKIGTQNNNMAVKIIDTCHTQERGES